MSYNALYLGSNSLASGVATWPGARGHYETWGPWLLTHYKSVKSVQNEKTSDKIS